MSTHSHHHDIDFKSAYTVTKEPGSQVKITGEIPYEELVHERAAAIKSLGRNIELDGFRKGHVPESMLVSKLGEMAILTEMAERALSHFYPHIVEAHELEVIGHPHIDITKLAPENPLGFTATVAILPTLTLPDYKQIATVQNKAKATHAVTDEEVDTQVEAIMRQKMAYERLQNKAAESTDANQIEVSDLPTPESEAKKEEEAFDTATAPLPEITDEYVATLGTPGQFATIADFKAKLREHLSIEKERTTNAAHRAKITDEIIADTDMELPQILIDSELNQMLAQMNEDLTRANMKMDEYLTHIKKSEAQLKADWLPAAEKRAKLQLVLNEIAKVEEMKPDMAALEAQVNELLAQYKDADPMRVRVYVASVMQNEAVMKMLEAL